MITQYLNINVIELFNADRITWSHRSSVAFMFPSSTELFTEPTKLGNLEYRVLET